MTDLINARFIHPASIPGGALAGPAHILALLATCKRSRRTAPEWTGVRPNLVGYSACLFVPATGTGMLCFTVRHGSWLVLRHSTSSRTKPNPCLVPSFAPMPWSVV
ncbi:hypothetical protein TcWFU_007617 [Taenia crassiceps]|uniref:Uncharacterized protein n=1 Tax=Taenia crassiceps TaxID=6207 RepID=A0ABR4PZC6_9CEST